MKILNLLIISFFLVFKMGAQEVTVELGPKVKFPSNRDVPKFLYGDENGYYLWSHKTTGMFSSSKTTAYLEKLDKELDLVSTKEFLSEDKGIYDEGIHYFQGKFIWMISDRDKENDRITYKVTPISLSGEASKPITLSKFKYERKRDIPTTNWHFNIDTTNLLFIAESDNDSKKENYQMHLVSVDRDLNTLWDKTLSFRKTEAQMTLLSKEVDSKGEAFLLYKVYDDKISEKKDKKPAYDLELLHIKNDTAQTKKYKLEIKDAFVKSANLKFRKNGELYCVGLFSNTVDGPIHGVFFMKLVDGQLSVATTQNFSDEDLENIGNKQTRKDKSGEEGLNDNFEFRKVEILDDGSAFVTVEPNFSVTSSYYTGRGGYSTTTTYYSLNIIIIKVAPNGQISQLKMIPKYQSSSTNIFFSHSSFLFNDKIYVIYNDDEDNYKKPIGAKPKLTSNSKDFVSSMTTLDKEGKLERTAILSHDDTDSIMFPKMVHKISENKYFFVTIKRKLFSSNQYTFGTINLSK